MLKSVLKNISLVYSLQALAVIFLFSYAGVSSGKETKGSAADAALPIVTNKEKALKTGKDSLINTMWKIYREISR
jgi:hypothetical protein